MSQKVYTTNQVINNSLYLLGELGVGETPDSFMLSTGLELLNELISERVDDITGFFEEYENELQDRTKDIIESFLDKMDNDNEYKKCKREEVKIVIYNNRDKVSKEIINQDLEIIV